MAQYLIYVVEDDLWYAEVIKHHLELNSEVKVKLFENGTEVLQALDTAPDIISLDYSLPDMTGNELCERLHKLGLDIPVIMISGQEDVKTAIEMFKLGLRDYIVKDEHTLDLLWNSVNRIFELQHMKKEISSLKEALDSKYDIMQLVGHSKASEEVKKHIEKAAHANINISLFGETGTGKEVVARAIHFNSVRAKQPFIAVNMAAIPKDLMESELMGHVKGAFTGANADKKGKFELSDKGTLFLDEIAELDLALQSKLLRVIQEREVTKIGGHEVHKLDFRLITATHKNLVQEVKEGRFREDLFYRIKGLSIQLPPLRDRGYDVILFAQKFINEYCVKNELPIKTLSKDGQNKLMAYHYPGNLRELKSIVELAIVMCDDAKINAEHITIENEFDSIGKSNKTLKELNIEIIQKRLEEQNYKVVQTAEDLGVSKSTLYTMIKNGELKIPEDKL